MFLLKSKEQLTRKGPCNKVRSRILMLSNFNCVQPYDIHIILNQTNLTDVLTQDYPSLSQNRLLVEHKHHIIL